MNDLSNLKILTSVDAVPMNEWGNAYYFHGAYKYKQISLYAYQPMYIYPGTTKIFEKQDFTSARYVGVPYKYLPCEANRLSQTDCPSTPVKHA